jgi:hypothetical protein
MPKTLTPAPTDKSMWRRLQVLHTQLADEHKSKADALLEVER